MADVLVWGEQHNGSLTRPSLEAFTVGKGIARSAGGRLLGAVAGKADFERTGAETVFTCAARDYLGESCVSFLLAAVRKAGPSFIILPATANGKDLAARLSAALDCCLASECTAVSLNGPSLEARRPVYGGKLIASVALSGSPQMVTLRPHAFEAERLSSSPAVTELAFGQSQRASVEEFREEKRKKIDLTEAEVVVSGGRGLGGAGQFRILEELAEALGGVVGASRSAVDAGWRPHSDQVGQTGKVVSPRLYIACGISGQIQHRVGMQDSKVIVAINKDPDAPIFKIADYGIVGDVFEVVPALTKALKSG